MLMRAALFAGAAALLCASRADAGISEDLRFCASLKSGKERLACYDAAARIEDRGATSAQTISVPRSALPAAPPASPATATRSPFDGGYVGVVGGYDIGVTQSGVRRYTSFDYQYAYPDVPIDSSRGGKVGGAIGYNMTSDRILLGFEARALYNFNEVSASATNVNPGTTLPWTSQWMWCSSPCIDSPDAGPKSYVITSSTTQTTKRSRPWQVDFSVRSGMIFHDWLVYAKTGVGIEQTEVVSITDNSATVTCTSPINEHRRPNPNELAIVTVGCAPGATSRGAITTTISRMINPTAIFGLGLERNFGQWFARAEGEMVAHLVEGSPYYTPSANFMLGYRF